MRTAGAQADLALATSEGAKWRLATVPNLLSLLRLVMAAIFCYLLFGPDDRVAASILLAVAGSTDFLDGYVARRFNQVSEVGKVLDPTADRVVLATGVVAITVYGAVPWWLTALVVGREALVAGGVLLLAALKAGRIDVIFLGKAGTFGLMACFPIFLLSDGRESWAPALNDTGWAIFVPAIILSFAAAFSYLPRARRALAARGSSLPGGAS